MGRSLFETYARHFDAVWKNPTTRSIADVGDEELDAWREGRGARLQQQ
jgi:hypothetical protein